MPLLLYSLSKGDPDLNDLLGVDELPVLFEKVDNLWVGMSELKEQDLIIPDKATELSQHPAYIYQEVVKHIHSQVPTVPVRLPTIVADQTALAELINKNVLAIHKELNRIDGMVEYTYHFKKRKSKQASTDPVGLSENPSPGTQYLLKKYELQRESLKLESDKERLTSILQSIYHDGIIEITAQAKVDRISVNILTNAAWIPSIVGLSELREKVDGYSVHNFGPYPPFHFVVLRLVSPT